MNVNTNASLGAVQTTGVTDDNAPVVFVNGAAEPRFVVESLTITGPLDRRSVRLALDTPEGTPGVYAHWLCAPVVVAVPIRLSDHTLKWSVIAQGVLKEVEEETSAGHETRVFDLVDAWDAQLTRPTESIWWRTPGGGLVEQTQGTLEVGERANKSITQHTINGLPVHALERDSGLRWTVGEALATVSAFNNLDLSLLGLPNDVANAELMRTIDLARPVEEALEKLLDDYSLTLRRELVREIGVVTERRAARPISSGRPIRLSWAHESWPIGDVLRVDVEQPAQAARQWVARAEGWRVESTFELVGGWDPALEGQADDEYDKDKSSDFTTYANAYRRWVLNEDGFFTALPYNRGPAYDLAALFGMEGVDPQPLVFEPCLTLEDDGSALKPIIEVSINSGADWSLFPGATDLLDTRAGVYLDPTALPPAFLTAAKAGTAKVRVTATLQSPLPMEITRWHGNALTGNLPPRVLDVTDASMFKRVDGQSIHHSDIVAGTLTAETSDDSVALHRWLVQQVERYARTTPYDGKATLTLAGTWTQLRPGDRLMNVRGHNIAVDGWPQAMSEHSAKVSEVTIRFVHGNRHGRTTTVACVF